MGKYDDGSYFLSVFGTMSDQYFSVVLNSVIWWFVYLLMQVQCVLFVFLDTKLTILFWSTSCFITPADVNGSASERNGLAFSSAHTPVPGFSHWRDRLTLSNKLSACTLACSCAKIVPFYVFMSALRGRPMHSKLGFPQFTLICTHGDHFLNCSKSLQYTGYHGRHFKILATYNWCLCHSDFPLWRIWKLTPFQRRR